MRSIFARMIRLLPIADLAASKAIKASGATTA